MTSGVALHAELCPLIERADLEAEWRDLEARGRPSFFLGWEWIGAFVDSLPVDLKPEVLRVRQQHRIVALGLLWRRSVRRYGFLLSRTLHLHATGDSRFDALTVEHNGLLVAAGLEREATAAALQHLAALGGWDELALAGLGAHASVAWREAAQAAGLHNKPRWEKRYFVVDLDRARSAGGYLEALSANTRYQARRAIRLYADRGELRCEHAASAVQALAWLSELSRMHQAHWTAKGQPGAFASDFAVRFHERLISIAWPLGRVQILRVLAGDAVIGYVYNFLRDGVVSNYQAGHVEGADAKLKPGLVSHCLAVEDALRDGHRTYDLLMGGEHFKPSLTNAGGMMSWSVVQRPRLVFRLEDFLRAARDRARAKRAASSDG